MLASKFLQYRWPLLALIALALPLPPATKAAEPKLDQVVVVFKTHFDIGYTDMAANVVQRYRTTMIDQALKVVDANRDLPRQQQFAWTIPGWPMHKIVENWPGQSPERTARVMAAFKDGRFVVHALPFSTHTESLEAEDLVSGLGFSMQVSRAAGLELPRDAKMTDVACHSWFVPTLLRHAGVEFLHLGCNAGCHSPEVPRLFWWEGPDGSRLLTMYTAENYGTGVVPPDGWPHKTWLALIHTGDNHGPPTPDEVKKLLDEARQKLPGVKIHIGRLSDFSDAILAEKPQLPIVRADMPDTWIHGPMSDPAGARMARNVRPEIATTQALNTLLRQWGAPVADASADIARAREMSLLYGEHTWGGALYWVTSYDAANNFHYGETWKKERAAGKFDRLEASWREHTSYIETAAKVIHQATAANIEALAAAVGIEGPRIVVFNPLPWRRDGLVCLADTAGTAKATALAPADGKGGPISADRSRGDFRFVARDLPAMGYRTYRLIDSPAKPATSRYDDKAAVMENRFFKVTLDSARGTVRSLIEKQSGRELIDPTAPHGFGQYVYERFDSNNVKAFTKAYLKTDAAWAQNELGKPCLPTADKVPYSAASPRDFTLAFEQTPFSLTASLRAAPSKEIPYVVQTRVVLYDDQPFVDLEVEAGVKPADPWPEAGWLALPVKAGQPQFRLGRLGSIIDPARDVIPGSNRHLFALNSGLTVTDPEGRGLGLCALDNFLVSLEMPGCWKYSRDFVPKRPWVYVNLFNNQWTTNFRMWNEGAWTSRVRLWPINAHEGECALATPAAEARYPLLASFATGPGGRLPLESAGPSLSQRGTLVTALGTNPGGKGTVLRLWEQAGRSGECVVQWPAGLKPERVQPIDLRGRPGGPPIPVKEGQFTLPLRPFAPVSLLIE